MQIITEFAKVKEIGNESPNFIVVYDQFRI